MTSSTMDADFSKLRGSKTSSTSRDLVEPSTICAGGGEGSFMEVCKGALGEDSLCVIEGDGESVI